LPLSQALPAAAATRDDPVAALREGGPVLVPRQAETEPDDADQAAADPVCGSTRRRRGREGRAQAKAIGTSIRA
jgi:hypothetical protein